MTTTESTEIAGSGTEHVDVIVVGAGISGIGAGYHLQQDCPDRSYVILEGRENLGGTWDLFRYPGVRSDSDMHTLGYSFKPWTAEKSIADGPSILAYLEETAAEFGIDQHIRYRQMVRTASWSSEDARWRLRIDDEATGRPVEMTCQFLFMCAGYYSYRGGHTPDIPGLETFDGPVIHPQAWPEDLDYSGRRVAVIGSGATAMTLVPAMAGTAAHVTMVQRSPTYVVSRPDVDPIDRRLRSFLPAELAYRIVRKKNIAMGQFFYGQTRKKPEKVAEKLLDEARKHLPDEMVEQHFTPSYGPWDQRLCLVPNGDLFESLTNGTASVVTGTIDTVTPGGIRMDDGNHVDADVIITATGLQLVSLGHVELSVDGETIDFAETWSYKGLAYSDVPNLVSSFGYINASWTLRADITCGFVTRLLNHLRDTGTSTATPRLRPSDRSMTPRPWIDDFSAGYIQRMLPMLPKQGDRAPWLNPQRYDADRRLIVDEPVDDGVMIFSGTASARSARSVATADV